MLSIVLFIVRKVFVDPACVLVMFLHLFFELMRVQEEGDFVDDFTGGNATILLVLKRFSEISRSIFFAENLQHRVNVVPQ